MVNNNGIDFIPDNPAASAGGVDFIPDQPAASGGFGDGILNAVGQFNDAVNQFKYGAGDAVKNTVYDAANLLPGVNIPLAHSGSGLAYTLGNIAGNVGAFLGGGELLDTLRLLGRGIPLAGKGLQWLGNEGLGSLTKRAIGSAAYGAVNDPNNRLGGALLGATTSGAADAIPAAINYAQPQKYAQGILDSLGNGQTLPEATQSAINSIQDAYKSQKGAVHGLYDSVGNLLGDRPLYNQQVAVDPTGYGIVAPKINSSNAVNYDGIYPNLSSDVTNNLSPALKNLSDNFLQNPTFENAHNLQSKLGFKIGKLSNSANSQDAGTQNQLEALGMARDALKNDMFSFLNRSDPSGALSQQYQAASDAFKNNVIPYRSNSRISKFSTGKLTDYAPNNFANIFKSPAPAVNKVIGDLPQSTLNNILYTKLGQTVPSSSPEALINGYNDLEQQGLSHLVSPSLDEQMAKLQRKVYARNALQAIATGGLASKLGSFHGIPEAAGFGLGGLAFGRPLMAALSSKLPISQMMDPIANATSAAYPYARNIALANYLANNGGQQ